MLGLIGSSANIPSVVLVVELKRPASVIVTVPPDVFVKVCDRETFDVPPAGAAVALTVDAIALANPGAVVSALRFRSDLVFPFIPVPKASTLNVPGEPEQLVVIPVVGANSALFAQSTPWFTMMLSDCLYAVILPSGPVTNIVTCPAI